MQDQTNSTIGSLMRQMKDLNYSFKRIESDIQIVKTVNNVKAMLDICSIFRTWVCGVYSHTKINCVKGFGTHWLQSLL